MLKTLSSKHLEITNANKELGEKNLELGKKITQLMKENVEQKAEISELKRKVKKHKKWQSMDKDEPTEDDIQVFLIEAEDSPVTSPVILPPKFFYYYGHRPLRLILYLTTPVLLSHFAIVFIAHFYRLLRSFL